MRLTSSLIVLAVLIASGFCDNPTTTVNPTTEVPKSSVQTTTPPPSTTVQPTSQQPNTTTPPPSTTEPPTSQQPNTTTVTPSTTVLTSSQHPNTTTVTPSTTVPTTSLQPNTTTVSPSTSSTNTPTTSSTIPPPTTTTNTTTAKPVTTPSPSSTSPPQSTTGQPVTSTKSPEPPTPVDGSWNVTEGNLTCIRADLRIRFKIPVKDHMEYVILSPNATSSGNCMLPNSTQELQLEEPGYTLTMIFEKDSDSAYLKNVTFSYTLPDSSGFVYYDTKLFSVKLGNSYNCDSLSNIDLKNVTMEVFHIHIRSFGNVGDKDFGTAESCQGDVTVDRMIPPAVGIVLLALVVVVLVGYFLERRRSHQRGLQNV